MKKFWLVTWHEYQRHVLRKRFLFSLLSVPALMGLMVGLIFIIIQMETNTDPIGYVDYSGLLSAAQPTATPTSQAIEVIAFASETDAEAALQARRIQAYFILPADYLQTSQVQAVSLKQLAPNARQQFSDRLRATLLAGQPPEIKRRLEAGDELLVRDPSSGRQIGENDQFTILVPFFASIAFMIATFTTSGYLMAAVIEEKENRTMEVLVTSVSPMQLMAGKIIGIMGVGLTQLLAWFGTAFLIVLVGRNSIPLLQTLHIPGSTLLLLLLVLLPAYVSVSAFMAAVGAIVTEAREGQSYSALVTMPVVIPFWLIVPIMSNPNGLLARLFSYIPSTAPVTVTLRSAFTTLPAWDLSLIVGIQVACAIAALWLAGRAFRLGMLSYGQRLSFKQILAFKRSPDLVQAKGGNNA